MVSDGQTDLVVAILTDRHGDFSAAINRFLATHGIEADAPSQQRILASIEALYSPATRDA